MKQIKNFVAIRIIITIIMDLSDVLSVMSTSCLQKEALRRTRRGGGEGAGGEWGGGGNGG